MATGVDKIFAGGAWNAIGRGNSGSGGGASTFISLTDVPATYAGSGSKVVSVKSDASGLEFTTVSASSFDTNFYATLSGNQAYVSGDTKITFNTIVTDGNTEWDAGNLYWKCKTSGYYTVDIAAAAVNTYTGILRVVLYIDGVSSKLGSKISGTNGWTTVSQFITPNLYIAQDSYLEAYCICNGGTTIQSSATATWFRVTRYK